MQRIRASLERNYFNNEPAGYLQTEAGRADMAEHLDVRLTEARHFTVPWLDAARPLRGASVLEIGCGTGSSSAAIAEQGADLTAIDISESSLAVARDRCDAFGLRVEFRCANAARIKSELSGRQFDVIVFFASLEHMTHEERMAAMKDAWQMLPAGGLFCVTETPNRLWYYDAHTSRLPFFNWLPDDLACKYARFSPRDVVRGAENAGDTPSAEALLRIGRGLSFHEFDLAIKPARELDVVSCKAAFYRRRSAFNWLTWQFSTDRLYESILAKACPKVHRGFLQPFLDIIIRKD